MSQCVGVGKIEERCREEDIRRLQIMMDQRRGERVKCCQSTAHLMSERKSEHLANNSVPLEKNSN
jgi:hypothetical protein